MDAAVHAALFAELTATAGSSSQATQGSAVAVADPPAEVDDEPMTTYRHTDTDTAALLRELASLGFDEETPPASPLRSGPAPSPRPAPASANKKRKGLFGRG